MQTEPMDKKREFDMAIIRRTFTADTRPRCRKCNKLLAEKLTRPWAIMCPRCKTDNAPWLYAENNT